MKLVLRGHLQNINKKQPYNSTTLIPMAQQSPEASRSSDEWSDVSEVDAKAIQKIVRLKGGKKFLRRVGKQIGIPKSQLGDCVGM